MHYKPLHIISFDNPYPPAYGGTIEVYYKIKALHDLGYTLYLHCFVSKQASIPEELKAVTKEVYFYKYTYNPLKLFSILPFSVISRDNEDLLLNIHRIKAPILFESLKTTLLVNRGQLKDYKKILRLHNIEHDYFSGIARSETNIVKKGLYYLESLKFKKYEKIITAFDKVLALSHFEHEHTDSKFGNSVYVPVFHGNTKVEQLIGNGKYALYHGDLKTSDNKRSAKYLIEIFKEIKDYELIIASGSNENYINKLIGTSSNIRFVRLKGFEHLKELLGEAQLNLIISLQKSGTKLKLLNALFYSRHCIINNNVNDDNLVAGLCLSANNRTEIIESIYTCKDKAYSNYERRKEILEKYMNDAENAKALSQYL